MMVVHWVALRVEMKAVSMVVHSVDMMGEYLVDKMADMMVDKWVV